MTLSNGPRTLQDYLALSWQPVVATDPDGGFVLTVPPLNDFAVYGDTRDEVESNWRDALASHLDGYMKCGKTIPFIREMPQLSGDTSTYLPDASDSGAFLVIA